MKTMHPGRRKSVTISYSVAVPWDGMDACSIYASLTERRRLTCVLLLLDEIASFCWREHPSPKPKADANDALAM